MIKPHDYPGNYPKKISMENAKKITFMDVKKKEVIRL